MAQAKYKNWITEEGITLLRSFARDGMTDEQIAKRMDIGPATLYRWKKQHFAIREALKHSKELYDNEVIEALHKKTLGYKETVKKHYKVKKIEFSEETGKKIRETEELVAVLDEVYIPPDTTAQMYWLNNRRPEEWKSKPSDSGYEGNIDNETGLMAALGDEE